MQKISFTKITKIDHKLFLKINAISHKWKSVDFVAIFFGQYAGYALLIFLFCLSFWSNRIELFIMPLLAGIAGRLINECVYFFYKRPRPSEIEKIVPLIKNPDHPSFPSSHSAFFFAVATMVAFFSLPLGLIFLLVTLLVVFSRIVCGVHWPLDILIGIVVGCMSAFIIYMLI